MMINVRNIFPRYFDILEENGTARYIQCKHVSVNFSKSETTDILWEKHDNAIQNIKLCDIKPEKSLLDLKNELASRIFKECSFCERRCKINRAKESGNCGVKQSTVASEFLHLGEESILIPSYTIFFSGCTFHCVFCQNWDISQCKTGIFVKPVRLVKMIHERKNQGARNVNWVGGDPTPNVLYILETLKNCDVNIPQIWNSNMYCSNETIKLLNGVIDLYLTDFKYGNDECAQRLSKVDDYMSVIKRNHIIVEKNGEMIIRHLIMPNHIECCSKSILRWIADNIPNIPVNIMGQYRPDYFAKNYQDISCSVSSEEIRAVKENAKKLQLISL
jgi:putative pyruvate formate lyase activating enzyme